MQRPPTRACRRVHVASGSRGGTPCRAAAEGSIADGAWIAPGRKSQGRRKPRAPMRPAARNSGAMKCGARNLVAIKSVAGTGGNVGRSAPLVKSACPGKITPRVRSALPGKSTRSLPRRRARTKRPGARIARAETAIAGGAIGAMPGREAIHRASCPIPTRDPRRRATRDPKRHASRAMRDRTRHASRAMRDRTRHASHVTRDQRRLASRAAIAWVRNAGRPTDPSPGLGPVTTIAPRRSFVVRGGRSRVGDVAPRGRGAGVTEAVVTAAVPARARPRSWAITRSSPPPCSPFLPNRSGS